MKQYIIISAFMCMHITMQAAPFVTTLVNTTTININLEQHFSGNNSLKNQSIAMAQSYQIVNFDDKILTSIVFTSPDKDKNGNFYRQVTQTFTPPTTDVTYNIALQNVAAHSISAAEGTDAFEMPATQAITCRLAPAVNKNVKK